MKKTISVLLTIFMLVMCLSFGTATAFAMTGADTAPAINLDEPTPISVSTTSLDDEDSICVAKFTPEEDGYYEFSADQVFSTGPAGDGEFASGMISVMEINDSDVSTVSFNIFIDRNGLTAEQIEEFEDAGMDLTNIDKVVCIAELKKDVEYYITFNQDGVNNYEANLTVSKHTHDLKDEERVNYEDGADGIYSVCQTWPCNYEELKEAYEVVYEITEGADQIITRGQELVITSDGPISKFQELYIDGNMVGNADYTAEEGSTIITVSSEYLDELDLGEHTIRLAYIDGKATTKFTIEEENLTTDGAPTTGNTSKTSPHTGAGAMSAIGTLAFIGAAAVAVKSRKEKE